MAISSITTNQANTAPTVQTALKTSGAEINSNVQTGSGTRNTDTVTISLQARKAAFQADNTASPLQTILHQAQQTAVQTANAAKDAAAAKASKAEQDAAAAKTAAAEQNYNSAKAAAAALAAAIKLNANAALSIAVAQAANAEQNANNT